MRTKEPQIDQVWLDKYNRKVSIFEIVNNNYICRYLKKDNLGSVILLRNELKEKLMDNLPECTDEVQLDNTLKKVLK